MPSSECDQHERLKRCPRGCPSLDRCEEGPAAAGGPDCHAPAQSLVEFSDRATQRARLAEERVGVLADVLRSAEVVLKRVQRHVGLLRQYDSRVALVVALARETANAALTDTHRPSHELVPLGTQQALLDIQRYVGEERLPQVSWIEKRINDALDGVEHTPTPAVDLTDEMVEWAANRLADEEGETSWRQMAETALRAGLERVGRGKRTHTLVPNEHLATLAAAAQDGVETPVKGPPEFESIRAVAREAAKAARGEHPVQWPAVEGVPS